CLPRPVYNGMPLGVFQGLLGVAGGFVLAGWHERRLYIAHYDLVRRRCVVRPLPGHSREWSLRLFYARDLHSLVLTESGRAFAYGCDLADGTVYARDVGGGASRAKQALLRVLGHELLWHGRHLPMVYSASHLTHALEDSPGACYVDPAGGTVVVAGRAVRRLGFVPRADGRPLLQAAGVASAQHAGGYLALRLNTPGRPHTYVFRSPDGAVVREYAHHRHGHRLLQAVLGQDGRHVALHRSDQRVEIESLDRAEPMLTTVAGGFTAQVQLHVGPHFLLLALGTGRQHFHLLNWEHGVLEHSYDHTLGADLKTPASFRQSAIIACLSRSRPALASRDGVPEALRYDPQRFVAGHWMRVSSPWRQAGFESVLAAQNLPAWQAFGVDR